MPEPERCVTSRGTWLAIWPRMWHELWLVLATEPCAPPDLFCDLARDLAAALAPSPTAPRWPSWSTTRRPAAPCSPP